MIYFGINLFVLIAIVYYINAKTIPKQFTTSEYKHIPYSSAIEINEIDIENEQFRGSAMLTVEISTKTNEIRLDSKGLTYSSNEFDYIIIDCSNNPDLFRKFCIDKPHSVVCNNECKSTTHSSIEKGTLTTDEYKLALKFTSAIENQLIQIILNYKGILYGQMKGFYHSKEENGKKLVCTKFEPTDASWTFPCADDPSLKLRFQISIIVPTKEDNEDEEYTAISNMPVEKKEGNKYIFKESPFMSTYLVAWVVSKFKFLADENNLYRVFASSDQYEKGSLALEFGSKVINELNKYTGINYFLDMKMDKIDQVAIPDFAAGAMENWGLVTYRERRILWDEQTMTTKAKQSIMTVISHEFAHQWFGNWVSPEHWGLLWLNEGFASYFEFFTTAELTFGLNLEEQFVSNEIREAFEIDSVKTARSMTVPKDKIPPNIRSIFDAISYSKASSVLYMIRNCLGKELFQKALRKYLKEYGAGNGNPEKLFNTFIEVDVDGKQIPSDIAMEFYKSWTEFPGYPLLSVSRENNKISLNQKRFLKLNEVMVEDSNHWIIPIEYVIKSKPFSSIKHFMGRTENDSFNLPPSVENNEWYLLNYKHSGYFRVNYDDKNWDLLIKQLKDDLSQINVYSRIQLVDDILILAENGHLSFEKAFNLIEYLKKENDFGPWKVAINRLDALLNKISGQTTHPIFKKYLRDLIEPYYKKIGFYSSNPDNENDYNKIARTEIVEWSCSLGLKDCLDKTKMMFNASISTNLDPNYLYVVFCNMIRDGNIQEWEYVWQQHENKKTSAEKTILYPALGCSSNVEILNRFLNHLMETSSSIREQDHASVFSSIYSNPEGVDVMLDFLSNNFNKFGNIFYQKTYIELAKTITKEKQKLKFGELKNKTNDELMKTLLNDCLVIIDINMKWNKQVLPKFNSWINQKFGNPSSRNIPQGIFFILTITLVILNIF